MNSWFQVTKKEIEKGREGGRRKGEREEGRKKERDSSDLSRRNRETFNSPTESPGDSTSFRQGGIQGLSHGNRVSLPPL